MASRYKLRCSIYGHEKDVRAVCPSYFPPGGFITASRDVTSRVWAPNDNEPGFHEGHKMSGHSGFVSCVCMLPPDVKYPQGLIVTGGQDGVILAYTLDSPEPIFRLKGHEATVCSLACGKFGTLLSGSWDKTARVWLNQKNVMTLRGHEAAVWAVAVIPEGGVMLTGSADKTIRMWRAGKLEKTFTGHNDCVRGLAVLSTSEFLSCSNDTTVRRWLMTGQCVQTYQAHESYIYSVATMANGQDFVTTGEDRTLRVWKGGQCEQVLTHPAQSVWAVTVLPNGDIVTGASDGVVRVFTSAPERQAPPEEQKAFEEQVATSKIPQQIGDIKTDQLPGPEALLNPGKKDGMVMMVREGGSVTAHQWSAAEGRWVKVGDVMGGSGGDKKTFKGKEYDFVFDVELDEGQPLKLAMNTSDDPWVAAHNFLEENEISQIYLDQVVKFILEQTKGVNLGGVQSMQNVDPYTGGSSYMPGPVNGSSSVGSTLENVDPFTAGSSYTPSGDSGQVPVTFNMQRKNTNQFFPQIAFLSFDTANVQAILGKLKQLNDSVDECHRVEESILDQLEPLMNGKSAQAAQLELLWKLLQWPLDVVFPVLDVLRLALKLEAVNEHYYTSSGGIEFLHHLLSLLTQAITAANNPIQMLVLRCLCNSFIHAAGHGVLTQHRGNVMTTCLAAKHSTNKLVSIALSSLLLNYSVSVRKSKDIEAASECLSAAASMAPTQKDPEANFRLLVCIGTLIAGDDNGTALAQSLDFLPLITRLRAVSDPAKLGQCARLVEEILR